MKPVRLLVIPGSVRNGSLNRKLAGATLSFAGQSGIEARLFDLRELALPVYDGDIEADDGIPDSVATFRQAIADSDALLFVTPEYNGFPTPLVINAMDWLSRLPETSHHPSGLATTANKPVALLSASPGPLGGLRAMNFLRQYLQMAFAMIVVPQQFALGRAHEAFDDDGLLKDPKAERQVGNVLDAMARLASALSRKLQ